MAWQQPRWKGSPNPFTDIPISGRPIKKIYIEDGKLKVEYDDLEPEGEESEET